MPTADAADGAWAARMLALVVAAGGAVAVLVRPVAPPVGPVPADDRWFDQTTLDLVAAYWAPLRPVLVVAAVVGAVGPLVVVGCWPGRRGGDVARRVVALPAAVRGAVVAAAVVGLQHVLLLGFRWWAGFVHAGAYGLTTQTWLGWLGDRAIDVGVAVGSSAVVGGAIVAIVHAAPRMWPLLASAALAALAGIALVVWPLVVEPLRFEVSPLAHGAARASVEATTSAAGWDDAPVLVADASRRTTRVNAYVSGFGVTRRVVLYDTLLELPPAQVAAVVAHEVAHDLHGDLLRGWLATAGALAGAGLVVDLWWRRVTLRVGGARQAVHAVLGHPRRLALVVATVLLVEAASLPVVAWVSRRVEASADATALTLVDDSSGTVALHHSLVERNLSDPSPPLWWQLWRGTHPPAAERLHRAEQSR